MTSKECVKLERNLANKGAQQSANDADKGKTGKCTFTIIRYNSQYPSNNESVSRYQAAVAAGALAAAPLTHHRAKTISLIRKIKKTDLKSTTVKDHSGSIKSQVE